MPNQQTPKYTDEQIQAHINAIYSYIEESGCQDARYSEFDRLTIDIIEKIREQLAEERST